VVEITAYQGLHPIFNHAIFAGDSDDDPDYWLEFGGVDAGSNDRDQDEINGNVYSGENILISDDATINGDLEASGDIVGGTGSTVIIDPPDIVGMDYPNNHDINVAQEYADYGFYSALRSADYGSGMALPEGNPAHIFHRNPEDRPDECAMTQGVDDYFFEDIYEENPVYNTRISVAPGGNDKVYFIDGDLWIHNKNCYSFQLKNPDSHITIVVQGNIHICDDFHYHNDVMSGVALVAIKKRPDDSAGEYSGNILIGDPTFGTISEINGFLFAENNFVDQNLDSAGSAEFYINGTMTAGNEVIVERDYSGAGHWEGPYPNRVWVPDSEVDGYHVKMSVDLDERVYNGDLVLPGLPQISPGLGQWVVLCWRETS
jgi:hypothetical protein